jgi:hypothetical protein
MPKGSGKTEAATARRDPKVGLRVSATSMGSQQGEAACDTECAGEGDAKVLVKTSA